MTELAQRLIALSNECAAEIETRQIAFRKALDEVNRLRAELDALKAQEPVAWALLGLAVTQSEAEAARWEHKGLHVTPLYAALTPSVPEQITPDGKYGKDHHYAEGWNNCINMMLEMHNEAIK